MSDAILNNFGRFSIVSVYRHVDDRSDKLGQIFSKKLLLRLYEIISWSRVVSCLAWRFGNISFPAVAGFTKWCVSALLLHPLTRSVFPIRIERFEALALWRHCACMASVRQYEDFGCS